MCACVICAVIGTHVARPGNGSLSKEITTLLLSQGLDIKDNEFYEISHVRKRSERRPPVDCSVYLGCLEG